MPTSTIIHMTFWGMEEKYDMTPRKQITLGQIVVIMHE